MPNKYIMKFLKTYPWHLLSHFDIYIVKLWFYKEYPSVQHRPPQFNTSVPHKDHTFSAPKIPQFNTKNLSVTNQKPEGLLVWNWGVCGTEGF